MEFTPPPRSKLREPDYRRTIADETRPHWERIPALATEAYYSTERRPTREGPTVRRARARQRARTLEKLANYVHHDGKPGNDPAARAMAIEHLEWLGAVEHLCEMAGSPHAEVHAPARESLLRMLEAAVETRGDGGEPGKEAAKTILRVKRAAEKLREANPYFVPRRATVTDYNAISRFISKVNRITER